MCRWGCSTTDTVIFLFKLFFNISLAFTNFLLVKTYACKWCGTRFCMECRKGDFYGEMKVTKDTIICKKCKQVIITLISFFTIASMAV